MEFVPKIKPIVEEVGAFVLSRFRMKNQMDLKPDGSIATEVDVAAEKMLKKELLALIPDAAIYAEESDKQESAEYRWIIDPIDGTKNFACGIPYFCVAVALEHQNQVIAAVTYAPALQECFYAERGHGMWWNDQKVSLDQEYWKKRTAALITRHSHISNTQIRKKLKDKGYSGSFRYYGAAALDLGYIAIGSIDVLISESIYWWDVAGGLLMVEEAGGYTADLDGVENKEGTQSIYAGQKELYDLIFEK